MSYYIFDVLSHFFAPSYLLEQHYVCVLGPFNLQIKRWVTQNSKLKVLQVDLTNVSI